MQRTERRGGRVLRRTALIVLNLAVVAALIGIGLWALGGEDGSDVPWLGERVRAATPAEPTVPCCDFPELEQADLAPVERLLIPSIEVDAPVIPMGMDDRRQMEIPDRPDVVSWYDFTALPGEGGNAVFAGHVNWRGADAAFEDLDRLELGDLIVVMLENGTEIEYRVVSSEPMSARGTDVDSVIADGDVEMVTLITCHGPYDWNIREYTERLVVQAERVP